MRRFTVVCKGSIWIAYWTSTTKIGGMFAKGLGTTVRFISDIVVAYGTGEKLISLFRFQISSSDELGS